MPTLMKIGNVKIQIFADDHNPPHFHVVAQGYEALVSIRDFVVLRGSIRRRDLETALEWAARNRQVLEHEWQRLNDR